MSPIPVLGSFFDFLGRKSGDLINTLGAVLIFFVTSVVSIFRRKLFRSIVSQVYFIGARSSLIVMLVGLFTGMVLGLQLYYTLVKCGSTGVLGSAVGLSLVRELGPVQHCC